jgi:hypothetical protein
VIVEERQRMGAHDDGAVRAGLTHSRYILAQPRKIAIAAPA